MAKVSMLCPFSHEMCRECPQYRGRHYYLCFCKKYRGYLGNSSVQTEKKASRTSTFNMFEVPPVLPSSSKWLTLNEFVERVKR
jgi:hypothetical protein